MKYIIFCCLFVTRIIIVNAQTATITGVPVSPITLSSTATYQLDYSLTKMPPNFIEGSDSPEWGSTGSVSVTDAGVLSTSTTGSGTITLTVDYQVCDNYAYDGSCDDPEDASVDAKTVDVKVIIPVSGVSVSPTLASVSIGGTKTLTATITPSNATTNVVVWGSDDIDIATVSDGVVTGVAAGSTTITATSTDGTDISGSCSVTVTDDGAVTGIDLEPDNTNYINYTDSPTKKLTMYAGDFIK